MDGWILLSTFFYVQFKDIFIYVIYIYCLCNQEYTETRYLVYLS